MTMKKINRVRKSREFQTLIHTGRKTVCDSFVLYVLPKKELQARGGISLSRKIGNAVVRNRIKRQVRMMCMELVDFTAAEYDFIIIVRHGYRTRSYADNKNDLEKLFRTANII